MASFFLVLQHGQVSFAWKYKNKIRWLERFRAKFRISCQPRTKETSVANCNTCRHSNKPVRCHVKHNVGWLALSAGKMLGSKWQLFLVLILIGWDKEARGLSANHKASKIRLLLSKLIWKSLQKLKTHLREKCSRENGNCLFYDQSFWLVWRKMREVYQRTIKRAKIRLLLRNSSENRCKNWKHIYGKNAREKMEIVFFRINFKWFRERGASSFQRITKRAK